jgi:sigma-B regulation protein RsbU (phosphoserine phosphatase)
VYKESAVRLNYGDRIFIYTDGVTETFNAGNEAFGEARLRKTLDEHKGKNLSEMAARIRKELDTFADGAPRHDDIAMLSIGKKQLT